MTCHTDQPTPTFTHKFNVADTETHDTLDAFVQYLDDTTTDGIHRLEIDRHEIRRMMKMFPSRSAKVGFFAVRWMQKPDDRVKIFAIYAV